MSIANSILHESTLPLQPGDRMTAAEFERRYDAMPEGTKAELIEGIVYVQAAVKLSHGQPISFMNAWISQYVFSTPGTDCAGDATDRLDESNQPQPDISLFILSENGGRTTISDDGYLVGGPELIVEISDSSVAIDRGPKLRTYERHGVQEYIIWRVQAQLIEWYILRDGAFQLQSTDANDVYHSEVFPGLRLPHQATLHRDGNAMMRVLGEGLSSKEHAAFLKRLAALVYRAPDS